MNTRDVLNFISASATFVLTLCLFHLLMDYTIGRIKIFQGKEVVFGMQWKDIAFFAIGTFIIFYFCSFYKPW